MCIRDRLNKNKMSEYVVDTVFIGGGTPSLLEENQISKIMSVLRDNCNMSENPEITICLLYTSVQE